MADFIDLSGVDVDNIPTGEIYEDGHELNARLTRLANGIDKNNHPYLMPWYEDPENVNLEDFSDFLALPHGEMTEKERGQAIRKLKTFAECFGIDLFSSNYNLDDAKGAQGWMILGIGKDKEGKPNNRPKKYLVK
jgi:hypothetical protein